MKRMLASKLSPIAIISLGATTSDSAIGEYSQLSHVVGALNSQRSSFDLRNRRQQKRGKNSNDGDDDQKFNQSERKVIFICVQSVFHLWLINLNIKPHSSAAGKSKEAVALRIASVNNKRAHENP